MTLFGPNFVDPYSVRCSQSLKSSIFVLCVYYLASHRSALHSHPLAQGEFGSANFFERLISFFGRYVRIDAQAAVAFWKRVPRKNVEL